MVTKAKPPSIYRYFTAGTAIVEFLNIRVFAEIVILNIVDDQISSPNLSSMIAMVT